MINLNYWIMVCILNYSYYMFNFMFLRKFEITNLNKNKIYIIFNIFIILKFQFY